MSDDWAVVDGVFTADEWEEIYEFLSENGCGWWYAVAQGDFSTRPDLSPGGSSMYTGTLMQRDHREYGNTAGDFVRVMKKRGITAVSVEI